MDKLKKILAASPTPTPQSIRAKVSLLTPKAILAPLPPRLRESQLRELEAPLLLRKQQLNKAIFHSSQLKNVQRCRPKRSQSLLRLCWVQYNQLHQARELEHRLEEALDEQQVLQRMLRGKKFEKQISARKLKLVEDALSCLSPKKDPAPQRMQFRKDQSVDGVQQSIVLRNVQARIDELAELLLVAEAVNQELNREQAKLVRRDEARAQRATERMEYSESVSRLSQQAELLEQELERLSVEEAQWQATLGRLRCRQLRLLRDSFLRSRQSLEDIENSLRTVGSSKSALLQELAQQRAQFQVELVRSSLRIEEEGEGRKDRLDADWYDGELTKGREKERTLDQQLRVAQAVLQQHRKLDSA